MKMLPGCVPAAMAVAAALLSVSVAARAECKGPQAMVDQMRAHPTIQRAVTLGSWYASREQFPCAVEVFRQGLAIDPKSAQLHYLTGLALVENKRLNEAVPELEASAELEPAVLNPHLMLANVYREIGKPEEAESQWRKALQIDPKSETALEGLGVLLLQHEDYPAVIELLKAAPHTERLTVILAKALQSVGYLEQAESILRQALESNPKSMALAEGMRVVLVKERKYDAATKLCQMMVSLHPNSLDAQQALVEVLILTDHADKAQGFGPKLLAARPKDPRVLYLNGVLQHAVGNDGAAKNLLEQAVALKPDFFDSRYYLGLVLVVLQEWKEAESNLQKAIELESPRPEAHYELALALRGLGEKDRATEEMKAFQALKRSQDAHDKADGAAAQGDRDFAEGKLDEAVDKYREAVEAQPDNAAFRFRLARALDESGNTAEEREQLERAVKLDPKQAGAQDLLGYVLSRAGDTEGAIEHFRKAVEAAPRWPEAWINLAAELAMTSRFEEARAAVAKALELDPQNAQAKELSEQLARSVGPQQK